MRKEIIFLVTVLVLTSCLSQKSTINPCWIRAASTGTVDENDREFILLGRRPQIPDIATSGGGGTFNITNSSKFGNEDAVISLIPNPPKGQYSVRYDIAPQPELNNGDSRSMSVRYFVDDSLSRVVVLLKKYNFDLPITGEVAKIISVFDSKNYPESSEFQVISVNISEEFDFMSNTYFLEAMLINLRSPSNISTGIGLGDEIQAPALAAIRICGDIIID